MTQPDGRETIIVLSASQSCHAGSISSAAPSSWRNSAITLSAEPPSELSMIRHVSLATARLIAITFCVF